MPNDFFPSRGGAASLDQGHVTREKVQIQETVRHLAGRAASGHYRSPRDHYVFAQETLTDQQLAQVWGTSVKAICRLRRWDTARGFDWVKMRSEFWRRVSSHTAELLEKQTVHELEDTAAQYRATVSYIIGSLRSPDFRDRLVELRQEGDVADYLKALNLTARTVKVCVDIEEKLTGAKLAQQMFDAQMQDYDWFVEVVKAFVREPSSLENIAKAIQTRRVTRTLVATGEYADAIAYARSPSHKDMDAALGLERRVVNYVGKPKERVTDTAAKAAPVIGEDFDL